MIVHFYAFCFPQRSTGSTDSGRIPDNPEALTRLDRRPFHLNQLAGDKTLDQFCRQHELDVDKDDVYVELSEEIAKADCKIFDVVILKEVKVSSLYLLAVIVIILLCMIVQKKVELFTGPGAHHIASECLKTLKSKDPHTADKMEQNSSSDQKLTDRVLVSCKLKKSWLLKQGTAVLRPVSKSYVLRLYF